MKRSIVAALIISMLASCVSLPVSASEITTSDTEAVAINEENFPDAAFRGYVETNFDTDHDKMLSEMEIQSAKKVDMEGNEDLKSLKGIEYLTELTYLNCSSTYETAASDDEVSKSHGGNVEELDVTSNLKLEELYCSGNQSIPALDVTKNTKLRVLNCENDGDIPELDVSNAPELEVLNAGSTSISTIDVSKNPKLKEVNVSSTHVTGVDVTKNPDLEILNMDACMNEDWEYCVESVDVTKNPKLKELDAAFSKITSVDVTKNPDLEILNIWYTNVDTLDISNNDKLVRLGIANTGISTIDVTDKPDLFALDLEMTNISEVDVTKNPKLYEIYMTGDKDIKSIDLTHNPDLTHLRISGTSISKLDTSKNPKLAALFNDAMAYENYQTFETVDIEPAPVESYDFSHNPELYEVYLNGADVSEIDVSNAPNLRHLHLDDTKIEKLDVTKNTGLVSLRVGNTKIKSLDLSNNKRLATLSIENTQIAEMKHLDFTGYPRLTSLNCNNAGVETLVFDKAPSVHSVKAEGNAIKEIDLNGRKSQIWGWFELEANGQTPVIDVYKGFFKENTLDLKGVFSDLSRVKIVEGEGYEYNEKDQTITFADADKMEFDYTWDTKLGSGSDEMTGHATIKKMEKLPFKDIKEDDWYHDAVAFNYVAKTMTGKDAEHFAPLEAVARAQFALILYRMSSSPEVEFKDVFPDVTEGIWYTDAILWANAHKIVTGYSTTGMFGPADKINREQLVTMMFRYANDLGMDTSARTDFGTFKDSAKVNDFAQEAMSWAIATGIITGKYNETMLDPQGDASRAECATIIERFMKVQASEVKFENASKEDVEKALKDQSAIVIDTRSQAAYSGWSTDEYKIGGHIDGATDFSSNWLTCTYDDENNIDKMSREDHLKKYMADKNISADSSVILYDENGKDAKIVGKYLAGKGVKDIKIFDLNTWDGAMKSYPNYQLYVPASVVKKLIDGEKVEAIGDVSKLIVLDVSWGPTEQSSYAKGHVPTAIHVNTDDFDDEDHKYVMDPDDVIMKLAQSQGITKDATVIVTGAPIFAARYASLLKYLGVEKLFIMSGGIGSWTDAGFELETKINVPVAAEAPLAETPMNPDVVDSVDEVEQFLKDPNFTLVDIRREAEYVGDITGYGYEPDAGHIPGAVLGYAGVDNSSSMLYYDNLDYTMRNADEILAMWKEAGISTDKHLSFMCGGGYRAGEVLWDAYVMGLTDVSVYADGWCGWTLAGKEYVTGK